MNKRSPAEYRKRKCLKKWKAKSRSNNGQNNGNKNHRIQMNKKKNNKSQQFPEISRETGGRQGGKN